MMMQKHVKKQPVAWALCRREHSVSVEKVALPLLRSLDKQVRLELEYLQQ